MQNVAGLAVRIGADLTELDKGIAKAERTIFWFSNTVTDLGKKLTVRVTAPLIAAGAAAVKVAADMDSLRKGLVAITGSSAAADAQLRRLREVAKLPGLGFEEAVQGAINLQAAGFSAEMAERSLRAFGNALATVGKGKAELDGVITALSQIQSKGKVSAEEINQLAERLPQIRTAMQAAFGTANTEALQEMGLTAKQFTEGVVREFEKLRKASGGANNSFANLTESMKLAAGAVGRELLPPVIALTDAVTSLFDRLNETNPEIIRWGIAFGTTLAIVGPLTTGVGLLAKGLVILKGIQLANALLQWASGFAAVAAAASAVRAVLVGMLVTVGVGGALIGGLALLSTWFIKNKLDALAARDAVKEYNAELSNLGTAQLKTQFNLVDTMIREGTGRFSVSEMDSLRNERSRLGKQLRGGPFNSFPGITVKGRSAKDLERKLLDRLNRTFERVMGNRTEWAPLGSQLANRVSWRATPLRDRAPALDLDFKGDPRHWLPAPPTPHKQEGFLSRMAGQVRSQIGEIVAQFGPLAAVAAALKPVFEGLMETLGPVLQTLAEPLRLIGNLIGSVVAPVLKLLAPPLEFLARATSYVIEGFGWLVRALGKAAGALSAGYFGKGLRKAGQDMIDMARETRSAIGATKDATEATREFAEALTNVPRVLRLAALRQGVGGGGGPVNPNPPGTPPTGPTTPTNPNGPQTGPEFPGGPEGPGGGGTNPAGPPANPGTGGNGGRPNPVGDPGFDPLSRAPVIHIANLTLNGVQNTAQLLEELGRAAERKMNRGGTVRLGFVAP